MDPSEGILSGGEGMSLLSALEIPTTVDEVLQRALDEDAVHEDVTTRVLGIGEQPARGVAIAREDGILCGIPIVERLCRISGMDALVTAHAIEGGPVSPGEPVLTIAGTTATVFALERTTLNTLQHLSGIATVTRQYVAAATNGPAVFDTRKTLPGLRWLARYAVRVGGGHNHRDSLAAGILIKDNHLRLTGSVRDAIARARARAPDAVIEIEVETVEDALEAAEGGADIILLDNMEKESVETVASMIDGRVRLEVSGGVTPSDLPWLGRCGVERVSVGRLTLGATPLDIAMDVFPSPA